MQVKILAIWIFMVLALSEVAESLPNTNGNGNGNGSASSRARHGSCNFRIVRDIMRRACAYHSSENSQLLGLDVAGHHHNDARNALSSVTDDSGEIGYPGYHGDYSGVRIKKEIELLYIRRILKDCCPNDGCPPLSKFCNK